jgi:hypothetical protein
MKTANANDLDVALLQEAFNVFRIEQVQQNLRLRSLEDIVKEQECTINELARRLEHESSIHQEWDYSPDPYSLDGDARCNSYSRLIDF